MFKPRWYCGRRTVELLEDRLLRVVVRLLGVEECHVLVTWVVGAFRERRLAGLVECLAQRFYPKFPVLELGQGVAPVAAAAPRRLLLVVAVVVRLLLLVGVRLGLLGISAAPRVCVFVAFCRRGPLRLAPWCTVSRARRRCPASARFRAASIRNANARRTV